MCKGESGTGWDICNAITLSSFVARGRDSWARPWENLDPSMHYMVNGSFGYGWW